MNFIIGNQVIFLTDFFFKEHQLLKITHGNIIIEFIYWVFSLCLIQEYLFIFADLMTCFTSIQQQKSLNYMNVLLCSSNNSVLVQENMKKLLQTLVGVCNNQITVNFLEQMIVAVILLYIYQNNIIDLLVLIAKMLRVNLQATLSTDIFYFLTIVFIFLLVSSLTIFFFQKQCTVYIFMLCLKSFLEISHVYIKRKTFPVSTLQQCFLRKRIEPCKFFNLVKMPSERFEFGVLFREDLNIHWHLS